MADSNTSLETQSSTVTFKKGKVIDFGKLAKAVDSAGFKASEIKIWARGIVEQAGGKLLLKVSGSNQTLPLTEDEQAAKLKGLLGKEIRVVGKLEFDKTLPSFILESFEM
ncbi:MAG: hypothetical protein HYY45_07155 [Deltaproteobacteria bacterium]|nr:hypothetical protein [Deltaproteobacteria bacterium]